jgi:hypothetical protein
MISRSNPTTCSRISAPARRASPSRIASKHARVVEDGAAAGDRGRERGTRRAGEREELIASEVGYPNAALEYFRATCGVDSTTGTATPPTASTLRRAVGHG